jgi:hypothetical protein
MKVWSCPASTRRRSRYNLRARGIGRRRKYATDDPMLAVIITNQDGKELVRIPAKDILPEPLR